MSAAPPRSHDGEVSPTPTRPATATAMSGELPRLDRAAAERVARLLTSLAAEPAGGAPVAAASGPDRNPAYTAHQHPDPDDDLTSLVRLAFHHRLPGLVWHEFGRIHQDDPRLAPLADAYRDASARHLGQLAQLAQLAPALGEADPTWMVIKGPVLAGHVYADPGLRTSLDIDILVRPDRFGAALAAIEDAGGRARQRNWPLLTRLELGQLVVDLPLGGLGDLHWHLVNTPYARRRFALDMDELRERRRELSLSGVRIATLDPCDTILHLCLHGALSGGHLLVWSKDVARAVSTLTPDWDELVRRAHRYGLGLVTAIQLERSRIVLGAPVDRAVITALAPGNPLVAARSRADRTGRAIWARGRWTGKMLTSALGSSTMHSVTELARRFPIEVVLPRLREAIGTGESRPPGQSLLTEEHGGERERERFLAFVSSQDGGSAAGPRRTSGPGRS